MSHFIIDNSIFKILHCNDDSWIVDRTIVISVFVEMPRLIMKMEWAILCIRVCAIMSYDRCFFASKTYQWRPLSGSIHIVIVCSARMDIVQPSAQTPWLSKCAQSLVCEVAIVKKFFNSADLLSRWDTILEFMRDSLYRVAAKLLLILEHFYMEFWVLDGKFEACLSADVLVQYGFFKLIG